MSIIPIDTPIGLKNVPFGQSRGRSRFSAGTIFLIAGYNGERPSCGVAKNRPFGDVFSAEADRVRYLFVNLQTNCRGNLETGALR